MNLSPHAFPFGMPDGPLALLAFALNLPLAASGGPDRARRMPWLPLLVTAKATVDALVGAWYLYQMPTREGAWCGYCLTASLGMFGILALSLPEAIRAIAALRGSQPLARLPIKADRG